MSCSLMVCWRDGTDILPLQWFSREGRLSQLTHMVEGTWRGRNWRGLARFDLSVRGQIADFDYERYKDFNAYHGMEIGIMRIQFGRPPRDIHKNTTVLWKAENEEAFRRAPVVVTIGEPPPSDVAEAPKRIKTVVSRILRDTIISYEIKQLYGGECQICGHGIILSDGTKYARRPSHPAARREAQGAGRSGEYCLRLPKPPCRIGLWIAKGSAKRFAYPSWAPYRQKSTSTTTTRRYSWHKGGSRTKTVRAII